MEASPAANEAVNDLAARPDAAGENLRRCYEQLVDMELVRHDELALVDAWLSDVATIAGGGG